MEIVQSFLPIMITPERRVIGAVPIKETTFQGTEASYTLSAQDFQLFRNDVVSRVNSGGVGTPHSFMAIGMSATQERQGIARSVPGFISMYDLRDSLRWIVPKNVVYEEGRLSSDFMRFLLGAKAMSAGSGEVGVIATPTASNLKIEVTTQLGIQPACSFFDINWVDLVRDILKERGYTPRSIDVDQSGLGSFAPMLKLFILNVSTAVDPTQEYPEPQFNTIRVIKMAATALHGSRSVDCSVATNEGVAVPVTLMIDFGGYEPVAY